MMVGVGSYIRRREKAFFFSFICLFELFIKKKKQTTKPPVFYNFKLFNFLKNNGLNT